MNEEEIKNEFRARLTEQRSVSYKTLAVIGIGFAVSYFAPCRTKNIIYLILIASAAYALYRTYKVWRCPACGRLLGDRLDINACPHCSAKFKD